ncbi:MAG: hypothetical protein J6B09_07270 [Clostridia bacterium]|nr:hypothetical protein [Clostridia bacterium]MBQ8716979.1 hypothetical protein [Clostridia bacterium]
MDLQIQASAQCLPHEEKLIRERHVLVAGCEACYRLFECGSHFLVEVRLGADCVRSDIGTSFSRAAHLYDLLVEGEVTPCTVQDILQDYALA